MSANLPPESLPLESKFWLEALRRYLEACPEVASQIALICFEDYLRENHRANHLTTENALLKVQLLMQQSLPSTVPKSNRNLLS